MSEIAPLQISTIPRTAREGILVVGVIMFVCLMPFFALREVGRVIGDDKLHELLFVRRN